MKDEIWENSMEGKDMDPTKFSKTITPICSTVLDLPPCCIEFVPNEERYFVIGTYDLQKEEVKDVRTIFIYVQEES